MKTGDCITHEEMMAILSVKMRFAACRDEPVKLGRLYRAKRSALDAAIREMIEVCTERTSDRLAKWEANPLPVKLPSSLQAAKDAAKKSADADAKPTCGDCRFCQEWAPRCQIKSDAEP